MFIVTSEYDDTTTVVATQFPTEAIEMAREQGMLGTLNAVSTKGMRRAQVWAALARMIEGIFADGLAWNKTEATTRDPRKEANSLLLRFPGAGWVVDEGLHHIDFVVDEHPYFSFYPRTGAECKGKWMLL